MDTFYITTAIDYPNARPHLGHALEKIGADAAARYKRLKGYEVFFTTGVDENSLNVAKTAQAAGTLPQAFVDAMSPQFRQAWDALNISYDQFIRTTEPRHVAAAREFLMRVHKSGDIYKGKYEGWYCLSCESYYPDSDLADGKCPVHATVPEWLSEENYFFRLSAYQERLQEHYAKHPEFVIPDFRKNEVLALIGRGLRDFSVSRSSATWGIPLPLDESQVIYVWFDALINYVTLAGFGQDERRFAKWWPANVHVIGKDILRFHAVYWPAMLMSAGLELPEKIVGHGFIDFGGRKMSKTSGVLVAPGEVIEKYGVDPLRFYLLREAPFLRDGSFLWENLDARYHSELANDLGNLLNRTTTMIRRYRGGMLPSPEGDTDADATLKGAVAAAWEAVDRGFAGWAFSEGLADLWRLVAAANRYVDITQPYRVARDPSQVARLDTILYNLTEAVRHIALLLAPTVPATADRIYAQLGLPPITGAAWVAQSVWGGLKPGSHVPGGEPLFPRLN